MKKVLFGIMALSMAVFANGGTNQNPPNPGTITGNGASASVPVRVIAEVVKPANALIITDEAGTILDELLLDHKVVAGTNTSDSVIAKNFKVKVTNGDGTVNGVTGSTGSTEGTGSHQVRIRLSDTTTTLRRVGINSGVVGENNNVVDEITSTLRLVNGVNNASTNEYTALLTGGEHLGTITSTIAAGSVPTAAGAYDNKVSEDMPTLSVTYSASGTFTK